MRFYDGAHEELFKVIYKQPEDQCLYLVADVGNTYDSNAVKLHNGKQKLGSVAAEFAKPVRAMLDRWSKEDGFDSVIVCKLDLTTINGNNIGSFKKFASVYVKGFSRVNERAARKFADSIRKGN